jgi:site-specific recombinase XerD
MAACAVQMLASKHAQGAGLDGVPSHTSRHTFTTRLLQRGANLREVQELLGHASPTTTATYTHIANRGLHDAVARLAETLVDWLDHQRRR